MALNNLSEKLDQLSKQDLGMDFDDAKVWSKLEPKLDNRKAVIYWWVAAACVLLAITFLLPGLFDNTKVDESMMVDQAESGKVEDDLTHKEVKVIETEASPVKEAQQFATIELKRKEILSISVAAVTQTKLNLQPIAIDVDKKENNKPLFAAEDISIIQASLEKPSIEKGRTISIRAQWQSSPDELNVNYQTLKIKLNEKH